MPKRNLFVLLLMIVASVVAWLARDRDGHGRRFAEVLGTIDRGYLERVDHKTLFDAAMEGVFSRLDEHSAFLAGDRRDQLDSLLDQEFGGVGVELFRDDASQGITVVSPVRDSPAWHAGIAAGDRILAIDGVATMQMPLHEAFLRLRGRPGTRVLLSVASDGGASEQGGAGEGLARDVALVREVVTTESVMGDRRLRDGTWEWMVEGEPDTAILRISSFGERTADELRRAVEAIEGRRTMAAVTAEQDRDEDLRQARTGGMLILDLRGNAGGLLSAAVEVCDIFLDEGVIVSTRGRGPGGRAYRERETGDGDAPGVDTMARDVRRATRGAALDGMPMAVLVDGLTASAAEVVAACLQDHGRAIVVGSRSFGKGTVQTITPLSDGSGAIKLTTAEYLRPSRVNIDRKTGDEGDTTWGVTPDRGCEITPTGRQIEALQAWRRARDVVPAKASEAGVEAAAASRQASQASLPRRIDLVLAKAMDALDERN